MVGVVGEGDVAAVTGVPVEAELSPDKLNGTTTATTSVATKTTTMMPFTSIGLRPVRVARRPIQVLGLLPDFDAGPDGAAAGSSESFGSDFGVGVMF
jgi:hypothetical protein